MSKLCFGLVTVFSIDSTHCQACEEYNSCMLKTYEQLVGMGFEKLTKRHKAKLGNQNPTVNDTVVKEKQNYAQEACQLNEILQKDGLIGDGWLSEALSTSPGYFQFVVSCLPKNEKVLLKTIVNKLTYINGDKVNAKQYAIEKVSLSVQVLLMNKIIELDQKKSMIVRTV